MNPWDQFDPLWLRSGTAASVPDTAWPPNPYSPMGPAMWPHPAASANAFAPPALPWGGTPTNQFPWPEPSDAFLRDRFAGLQSRPGSSWMDSTAQPLSPLFDTPALTPWPDPSTQSLPDIPPAAMPSPADPRSSWIDPKSGGDVIHQALGLESMPTSKTIGAFESASGPLEINPGWSARSQVDMSGRFTVGDTSSNMLAQSSLASRSIRTR
jgi:hypothetical protein